MFDSLKGLGHSPCCMMTLNISVTALSKPGGWKAFLKYFQEMWLGPGAELQGVAVSDYFTSSSETKVHLLGGIRLSFLRKSRLGLSGLVPQNGCGAS